MRDTALVITSIAGHDHPVLQQFASACEQRGVPFYLIGDSSSPGSFGLPGCRFFSLQAQRKQGFSLGELLPEAHYSRKNLGYLLAIRDGAQVIIESDDDNVPLENFWNLSEKVICADVCESSGWVNVYKYFTDIHIWPRGFPLELVNVSDVPEINQQASVFCPVQQGLVQKNPDVDAIYRLTMPLPVYFEDGKRIILRQGSWSPFNSQHTVWFKEAFPLMYLPSTCSFRMTDVWRSYIAQRILYENGWGVCYHSPVVIHERNESVLMHDFRAEIPGFLNNFSIVESLENIAINSGPEYVPENLLLCYEKLVSLSVFEKSELQLLEGWLNDLKTLGLIS